MPFLMTDVAAGAKAAVDQQRSWLDMQYDPGMYQMRQQEEALKLQGMVRSAEDSEQTRVALKALQTNPDFTQADNKTKLSMISNAMLNSGNPEKAAKLMESAARMEEIEANRQTRVVALSDDFLDRTRTAAKGFQSPQDAQRFILQTAQSMPKDVAPLLKPVLDQMQRDLSLANTPERFAMWQQKYASDTGPLGATKNSIAQQRADAVQRREDAREANFERRQSELERHNLRLEAMHTGAQDRANDASMFKSQMEMHRLIKEARQDITDDEDAVSKLGKQRPWEDGDVTLRRQQLKDRIQKNKDYVHDTQETLRQYGLKQPPKSTVTFKVDDGFTANKDQEESIENAIKAVESGKWTREQVIQKLRANGIMVN